MRHLMKLNVLGDVTLYSNNAYMPWNSSIIINIKMRNKYIYASDAEFVGFFFPWNEVPSETLICEKLCGGLALANSQTPTQPLSRLPLLISTGGE